MKKGGCAVAHPPNYLGIILVTLQVPYLYEKRELRCNSLFCCFYCRWLAFFSATHAAPTGLPPPSGTPSINRGRVLLRVRLITERLTDGKKLLYKYLIYTRKGNCVAIPFSVVFIAIGSLFFRDPHGTNRTPSPFGDSLYKQRESSASRATNH